MTDRLATATQFIEQIDLHVDAVRTALVMRIHCQPMTARDYQAAWDRNPDLFKLQHELYCLRGWAQEIRDHEENRAYAAQQRSERAKRAARNRRAA